MGMISFLNMQRNPEEAKKVDEMVKNTVVEQPKVEEVEVKEEVKVEEPEVEEEKPVARRRRRTNS